MNRVSQNHHPPNPLGPSSFFSACYVRKSLVFAQKEGSSRFSPPKFSRRGPSKASKPIGLKISRMCELGRKCIIQTHCRYSQCFQQLMCENGPIFSEKVAGRVCTRLGTYWAPPGQARRADPRDALEHGVGPSVGSARAGTRPAPTLARILPEPEESITMYDAVAPP